MAVLGMTKLDAVNEMLESIDEERVAALDTGGSSIEAKAEKILDRESRRVQSGGWPENAVKSRKFTPAAGLVTVPAATLWIRSSGPSQHRNLVLRGDGVYDADNDTSNLGTTDIFLDIVSELSFESCSPKLKDVIVKHAMLVFQRRQKGELAMDGFLQQETAAVEIVADRLTSAHQNPNVAPVLPQPPQQSSQ